MRFVDDKNKNGIWDPGNYLEKRQFEPVEFYALPDGIEVIVLLENTEIDQNIDVKQVFARDRRKEVPAINEDEPHDHDEHGHEHDHVEHEHGHEQIE
jgi:hypothetical protein